jgi:hypothetical protein
LPFKFNLQRYNEALTAGGEAFHTHPAYLRAFARVAEAAVAQGAAGELPAWSETCLGGGCVQVETTS